MRKIKRKLTVMGLGAALLSSLGATAEAGCSDTIYTGTVCFMAADFCPRGFIRAVGQTVAATDQTTLFALYGDLYGGNGQSTMGIPDLRGRAPVGFGQGPGMQQSISLGLERGTQVISIQASQLTPHVHTYDLEGLTVTGRIKASSNQGPSGNPAGNYLAASTQGKSPQYKKSGTKVSMAPHTVSGSINTSSITSTTATGGGFSFGNQGPRLGLTACIADSTNLFPPRN